MLRDSVALLPLNETSLSPEISDRDAPCDSSLANKPVVSRAAINRSIVDRGQRNYRHEVVATAHVDQGTFDTCIAQ